MKQLRPLAITVMLFSLAAPIRAASPGHARTRTTAIIRAKEGPVAVRCSHGTGKTWRGIELHPGDTIRVGPRGWASVSVAATGARFLLMAGCSVRIENSELLRLAGPVPQRGYDTPGRDPVTAKGRDEQDQNDPGTAKR